TVSGMLNSIGLDNDGIEAFLAHHMPYLASLGSSIIVSIAGRTQDEFVNMAGRLDHTDGIAALELNVSCPNVSGGVDFGTDPQLAAEVVKAVRGSCEFPVIAKLTPNVTEIAQVAQAAADAGAPEPTSDSVVAASRSPPRLQTR
ncbi:MAG: hypothetical protein IH802_07410, partial [Nitrospinae bacterium]|nr:hypothetical protein [Nitrospinota bacterium]